jgi:hypothetical protein
MNSKFISFLAAFGWLCASLAGCDGEKAAEFSQEVTETHPGVLLEFLELKECKTIPIDPVSFCGSIKKTSGSTNEYARIDADGDEKTDLVIRSKSSTDCGSHGCSTYVLLRRGSRLVLAGPPLITFGPVQTCGDRNFSGIRFPASGGMPPCLKVEITHQ